MEYIEISIADDFSKTPGPRNISEGDFSGELFYNEKLSIEFERALKEDKKLRVDLDRTAGYGTSFLEESFGGLARKHGSKKVLDNLEIISIEEPYLKDDIRNYINDAQKKENEK